MRRTVSSYAPPLILGNFGSPGPKFLQSLYLQMVILRNNARVNDEWTKQIQTIIEKMAEDQRKKEKNHTEVTKSKGANPLTLFTP